MSKLEISQMLTLSTAHLTEETLDMLDTVGTKPMWAPKFTREDGWMFYTADVATRYKDAPVDLRTVAEYAAKAGCTWLMLDQDGDTVDDLPDYWNDDGTEQEADEWRLADRLAREGY